MKKLSIFLFTCLVIQAKVMAQLRMTSVPLSNSIKELERSKKLIAFRLTTEAPGYSISGESNNLGTALEFRVTNFDSSNNIRNNKFVVPEDGVYHFDMQVDFTYDLQSYKNFYHFELMLCSAPGTVLEKKDFKIVKISEFVPFYSISLSTTRALPKGFIIYPSFKPWGENQSVPVNITMTSFSGFKISKE